ncbi:type II toxin-antitoxin system RelE/ParE family toxin [Euzebya sp.]|uniref:type II toxin-antitoxin system RelE/ParE family toxin n=1 Tax=Euzebya sp. TaxID=1971409 RepID=UPI003516B627
MGDRHRVILRQRARGDVEAAVDWYRDDARETTALRFVDAVEAALAHVGQYPGSGSPRYSVELQIPGLRCWPLASSPYLIFYVERDDHVDVWRLLHAHRDVPAWMRDPDEATAQS